MKSQIEFLILAVMPETDFRRAAGDIVHAHVGHFEQDLPAIGQTPIDQILHHLLLTIDGHAFADELAEIDVVQCAVEAEMNAVVEHRLALHALTDAGLDQEVGRPLLQKAGADTALDVIAAAVFQDDGFDPRKVQQMRQHQPRGACTDDPDWRTHALLLLPAERPML